MTVRVGINGFGRIGRNFFRAVRASGADIEIVGVNDLTDNAVARAPAQVRLDPRPPRRRRDVTGDAIIVGGRKIAAFEERDPAKLPWGDLGADIVIESTGFFTDATKAKAHIDGGAKKVIISAPAKQRGRHRRDGRQPRPTTTRARTPSSPTRRARPTAWRRWPRRCNDEFGIVKGLMTTIHAYTAGPEPPGQHPQGPASCPRCRDQHRARPRPAPQRPSGWCCPS